jgi:hypothetical protein
MSIFTSFSRDQSHCCSSPGSITASRESPRGRGPSHRGTLFRIRNLLRARVRTMQRSVFSGFSPALLRWRGLFLSARQASSSPRQGFPWTAIGYFCIDFQGIHPFRRTRVAGTRFAPDGTPPISPRHLGWMALIPIGAIHNSPRAPCVQINSSAASPHKQQAAVTSIGSRVRLAWRFLPRAACRRGWRVDRGC